MQEEEIHYVHTASTGLSGRIEYAVWASLTMAWEALPDALFLDAGRFRDGNLGYACGGSGSLFKTSDGGDSWKRVRATDDVAGNLYAIKWQKNGAGYILGNDGILLKFIA